MHHLQHAPALTIAGIALRTHNAEAFETIPALWQRFMAQQMLSQIPHRLSDEVYAVYCDYDRRPQSAEDVYALGYTLIVGAAVSSTDDLPAPLVSTRIPAAQRAVFEVQAGRPDLVGAQWQQIWQLQDLPRAFAPDYEHYARDGRISICVSIDQLSR